MKGVIIARNEDACKLLDCLVAYRKLVSINAFEGPVEASSSRSVSIEVSARDLSEVSVPHV